MNSQAKVLTSSSAEYVSKRAFKRVFAHKYDQRLICWPIFFLKVVEEKQLTSSLYWILLSALAPITSADN